MTFAKLEQNFDMNYYFSRIFECKRENYTQSSPVTPYNIMN